MPLERTAPERAVSSNLARREPEVFTFWEAAVRFGTVLRGVSHEVTLIVFFFFARKPGTLRWALARERA